MYACVVKTTDGEERYSSFFVHAKAAIKYAERMPGVIRVEVAHATDVKPIWVREKEKDK